MAPALDRDGMFHRAPLLALLLLTASSLLVNGCVEPRATGSVRGRVVDGEGQPVRSARVLLDDPFGQTTLTNARGEFRIGGARDGNHEVFALDATRTLVAGAKADVSNGGVTDVGDLVLGSCTQVGSGGTDPNEDYAEVCGAQPSPPPTVVSFDRVTATWADGYVDEFGLNGYGEDSSIITALDWYVPGDFRAGGEMPLRHVTSQDAIPVHVGLNSYQPELAGYYYVLREGDVSLSVFDDGDGDPASVGYRFHGENLVFEYLSPTGGTDGTHVATVGFADAEGIAWQANAMQPGALPPAAAGE